MHTQHCSICHVYCVLRLKWSVEISPALGLMVPIIFMLLWVESICPKPCIHLFVCWLDFSVPPGGIGLARLRWTFCLVGCFLTRGRARLVLGFDYLLISRCRVATVVVMTFGFGHTPVQWAPRVPFFVFYIMCGSMAMQLWWFCFRLHYCSYKLVQYILPCMFG